MVGEVAKMTDEEIKKMTLRNIFGSRNSTFGVT